MAGSNCWFTGGYIYIYHGNSIFFDDPKTQTPCCVLDGVLVAATIEVHHLTSAGVAHCQRNNQIWHIPSQWQFLCNVLLLEALPIYHHHHHHHHQLTINSNNISKNNQKQTSEPFDQLSYYHHHRTINYHIYIYICIDLQKDANYQVTIN